MALATLGAILVGTGALIGAAVARRRQQERYHHRVRVLRQRYRPLLARLLAGKHCPAGLEALQALPLSEREILIEPLLSDGGLRPNQVAVLRKVCEELGLVEVWQRRLAGELETVSFQGKLSRPAAVLHSIHRLNFLLRATSARNLGILRHQPSWPLLMKALDDPHPDVQSVALRALAAIREPQSFAPLVARFPAAIQEHSLHLSTRSLQAAAACFPLSHAADLMPSLSHLHPRVRSLAIDILGEMLKREADADLNSVVAVPPFPQGMAELFLTRLGRDEDAEVRARAAAVIARLEPARAAQALRKLLHDDVWFVRLRTLRALADHPHLLVLAEVRACLLDPHWRVRETAAHALLAYGPEGIVLLFEYCLDTSGRAGKEQVSREVERAGVVSLLVERSRNGADHPGPQVIEQLVRMGAARYLVATMKNGSGNGARQKARDAFTQLPNPQAPSWAQLIAALEAKARKQKPASAPDQIAA
jgi:HEAT repeat protein